MQFTIICNTIGNDADKDNRNGIKSGIVFIVCNIVRPGSGLGKQRFFPTMEL